MKNHTRYWNQTNRLVRRSAFIYYDMGEMFRIETLICTIGSN